MRLAKARKNHYDFLEISKTAKRKKKHFVFRAHLEQKKATI